MLNRSAETFIPGGAPTETDAEDVSPSLAREVEGPVSRPEASEAQSPALRATASLRAAVYAAKAQGLRQYQIARSVGYRHPTQLSHILAGSTLVRRHDVRARRLCEQLGVSFDSAFEAEDASTGEGAL